MDTAIAVHLAAALPALGLGALVLRRPKGTPIHKALGRIWIALMVTAAASSFWISGLNDDGGFSWIHGLSVWTLFSLAMALGAIRRGNISAHRAWMIGTFVGLLAAGAGALAPGRLISTFLFG